jgi:hypothetical protein
VRNIIVLVGICAKNSIISLLRCHVSARSHNGVELF